MTHTHLVFVCETAPGFACLAAAMADVRSEERVTAVGGPARTNGFLDERLARIADRFDYDVPIGRVTPLDPATIREADRVVAMGDVPAWVTDGSHIDRWEGPFPAATEPTSACSTVERIEHKVDGLFADATSTPEPTRPVSTPSSSD